MTTPFRTSSYRGIQLVEEETVVLQELEEITEQVIPRGKTGFYSSGFLQRKTSTLSLNNT